MPSVRDKFFNTIFEMIKFGEDIYVVSADLGAPSLDDLRKYFPNRFINVGIAEQSLISISAGLAVSSKKVIAYGLNPFPVTRAYDQLRCLMGELKIPVTLCALNSGCIPPKQAILIWRLKYLISQNTCLAYIRLTRQTKHCQKFWQKIPAKLSCRDT